MSDSATREFTEHRELLFSVVYSMLGSVADTEDVLQETWVAWAPRAEQGEIAHPRAYLVRIAVNKALARQEVIRRRRETYVGPWLPEPLVTTEEPDTEAVSMALMVVLETLTPLERAVFILHEVFGYSHPETAQILGRSPASVRQLAHRAREHVQARRPRYRVDPRLRHQVTERFAAAVGGGDLDALLRLLAPDVTMWADGGGKATDAGPRPVHGRDQVAQLLATRGEQQAGRPGGGLEVRYRLVNGDPSALLYRGERLFGVLVLDLTPDDGQVCGIYFLTNPDKFAHLSAQE
ncbi:RNA polymerase sigma factor SigJ [Kitasatospora azatica]|uniref:RNA polymerase sigma factor SigJ n=1 Tax=Kitasatospora azatica TaxID=58347 RepID=UPI00055BFE46|nr:RNA polymerase sigma factor SigJ [Kitasatospora azatica]